MRTSRGELDIRKEFGFYDLGFTAAIGANNVAVYEHLRRFVWRKGSNYEQGRLVAKVSQTRLATLTGLRRETICRSLVKLKSIGWVDTEGEREDVFYILGEVIKDRAGGVHEVFFADAVCTHIAETIGSTEHLTPEEIVSRVQQELGMVRGVSVEEPLVISDHNLVTSDHNLVISDHNPCDLRSHIIDKGIAKTEIAIPIHPSGEATSAWHDPERSEGEILLSTPPEEEDQTPAAATHRVEEVSDGVPVLVEERRERASNYIDIAKARSNAVRQAKMDKASAKDQKMRNLGGKGARQDPSFGPLLGKLERVWKTHFKRYFPNTPVARWEGREHGQVRQLIDKYNGGFVESGFTYITANWEKLRERFKKSPKYPTVGFLLSLHDSLIPEAVVWNRVASVKEEWDSWWKAHPNEFDPPEDLKRRYDECRKDLETLGIV